MLAGEVTAGMQAALELHGPAGVGLSIVQDRGSQFVSREWREFVAGARICSIPTRLRHPESNGLLERMHCTHRHEGPFGTDPGSYELAVEAMSPFARFTNNDRPHSALHYLCPAEVRYGDPEALLARREEAMRGAKAAALPPGRLPARPCRARQRP